MDIIHSNSKDGFVVVHASLDGSRGVDFNLKQGATVVYIKDPDSISELTQAMGRGYRRLESTPSGLLFVSQDYEHSNCNYGNLKELLEIKEDEMIKSD